MSPQGFKPKLTAILSADVVGYSRPMGEDEAVAVKILESYSIWAAYFGDSEFAMEALEKGVEVHASGMANSWWPVMKEVRQSPRFKGFLNEIDPVDYWKKFGWPDLCHPVGDGDFKCD